jgi:two-component system, NtrC family, nitrogen regulation sensor histidine kinase NtrY
LKGKENGMIEIVADKNQEGKFQIQIIDNGPGIPSEISDEIFVPFFTTKEGGMGVGLSHSKQIVRAHGGAISCQSNHGVTVFTIQL